uniref:Ig-like domain-containing protein n=1 Tax=Pygocentrus nattereri TaxID=42514 RepID=A0A3B4D0Z6_PYGNA
MALIWWLTFHLYMICKFMTESGGEVTLHCNILEKSAQNVKVWVWYMQRTGHEPQEVAAKLTTREAPTSSKRHKISQIFNLTIEQTTKAEEGMYFCGKGDGNTITFTNGVFLAVTGQLNTSVLQTAVRWSVSPGESVTLQCTVMSEISAADLRVLWFRAAAGQSFPEIIYTHQNSSSRQCEISSSTSCSLYEFSKNILDQHHTGTYYCAVAVCGKIIFGNGTSVQLSKCSCVLLGTCSIFVLFMFIWVLHIGGKNLTNHVKYKCNTENLHYAAIHIKEKKAKGGRVKREQPEDVVYSHVRSSNAAAQRSHR